MQLNYRGVMICAVALFTAQQSLADGNPDQICDDAAQHVASETSVPLAVLQAVSRQEAGRPSGNRHVAWPWTINMGGHAVWFETEDQARVYVFNHFKQGARSFDVGCFQINYHWHSQAFNSIEEMFDPLINTRYAAAFLSELYRELGDWTDAAGAFHTRTRSHALPSGSGNANENPAGELGEVPLLMGNIGVDPLGSLTPQSPSGRSILLSGRGN